MAIGMDVMKWIQLSCRSPCHCRRWMSLSGIEMWRLDNVKEQDASVTLDDKRQFSADMVPWKIVLMLKVNTRDNLYVKEDNNEYRRSYRLVLYSSHPPPQPSLKIFRESLVWQSLCRCWLEHSEAHVFVIIILFSWLVAPSFWHYALYYLSRVPPRSTPPVHRRVTSHQGHFKHTLCEEVETEFYYWWRAWVAIEANNQHQLRRDNGKLLICTGIVHKMTIIKREALS